VLSDYRQQNAFGLKQTSTPGYWSNTRGRSNRKLALRKGVIMFRQQPLKCAQCVDSTNKIAPTVVAAQGDGSDSKLTLTQDIEQLKFHAKKVGIVIRCTNDRKILVSQWDRFIELDNATQLEALLKKMGVLK